MYIQYLLNVSILLYYFTTNSTTIYSQNKINFTISDLIMTSSEEIFNRQQRCNPLYKRPDLCRTDIMTLLQQFPTFKLDSEKKSENVYSLQYIFFSFGLFTSQSSRLHFICMLRSFSHILHNLWLFTIIESVLYLHCCNSSQILFYDYYKVICYG